VKASGINSRRKNAAAAVRSNMRLLIADKFMCDEAS
jgi:hypothetical protein